MYTKAEIVARIRQFNTLLEREMRLKEELVNLKLRGPRDLVQINQKRHDEILAEIDDIHMNQMFPILKEMIVFVAQCERMKGQAMPPHQAAETWNKLKKEI